MTETLGQKLKDWRVSKYYTLRSLARELGVSHQYISQIEKGKRGMSDMTKGIFIEKFGPVDFVLARGVDKE